MKQTVFEFKYNPDVYDSAAMTVSIHKTRKGAKTALDYHKAEQQRYLDLMYKEDKEDKPTLDEYQWWGIEETELLE